MGFATTIGKYQLGRTIGEGTFAKVKVAANTVTGQLVAIKIIDKQMVIDNKLMDQVDFSGFHGILLLLQSMMVNVFEFHVQVLDVTQTTNGPNDMAIWMVCLFFGGALASKSH